ncbi:probable crossover junction endonuclease EME2 isoform X4 [Pongo abelii]|uniref:probable crossover junction endonuclease EME2 isoform X4 n=1 Tax=Pongo abelii TaxID=9601 RepID=UPI0023E89875|nr:probable crossover junction endonuclease EME2 isoform X4 [Pongo abelii]
MARVGPGRAGVSCRGRGRGRGRGGSGQRRPPTWEISDSDAEGSAGSEAATRARDPAGERRAAAEALRLLRPEQVLKRLAVCVDPAILEDAGADVLMGALEAVGCECRIEPQRPARSLRWTRASPDPCPRSLPPEVWAAGEQELLLLLEPEEFLQGVATLTQISGPTRWVPWISPETTARPHLAVIGLDAYLWSRQHVSRRTQQPERPKVAGAEVAVGWPEVEEALVLLQLWANLDVLLVASWQELSRHVCAVTKALAQYPLKCSTGNRRPFPSAQQGTGQPASQWQETAQGCRQPGGGRSGSSVGSAQPWLMQLSQPSPPPAFCSRWAPPSSKSSRCRGPVPRRPLMPLPAPRRSRPAARSGSAWASWPTFLCCPVKAGVPAGWGLTCPAASASS